jgi:cytochrome P450
VVLPSHPGGVLAQTVRFHRDPLGFLRAAQAELGDAFTVRLLTARPLAIVADPDAVARLLDSDHGPGRAGEARRLLLPFAATRSVFGADADAHTAARARIAPAFAAAAMSGRREAIAEIASRHASRWPTERPFQLLEAMREITDEVFVRLVLGVRDERIATGLIGAVRHLLTTPGNPPSTLPGRGDGLAGALGQRLFERRQAPLARHLAQAVEARRGEADGDQPDVLGCMIGATPALRTGQIVDELASTLMAAQEPPAIALAWVLDRIAREPDLPPVFRTDPEGERAGAAIAETLRLQPPASAALRRLAAPFELDGGLTLPAGISVVLPTALLQRDSRGYEQPDRFLPDRWRDGQPTPGFYFPFGGGARRCIGEPLARVELAAVVPAILSQVRLFPLAGQPEPMVQRATVLVPKRGLMVRAEKLLHHS